MNTENNEERQINDESQLPGDVLRQAREQQGFSQKDIANRLRLRLSVIDDIENNRFDQSQLATFTRGYVRSYAKYVGLDEEAVLVLLDKCGHAKPAAQEMQSFSRRTKREAHDSRIMGLTWILAAVFVGVTAVWWWQNIHLDQQPEATETVVEAPVAAKQETQAKADVVTTLEANTEVVTPVEPTAQVEAPTTPPATETVVATPSETPPVTTSSMQETPATTPEVTTTTQPDAVVETPAVPDVVAPQLQLTFSADCWIDIRDATGKRLESGIKKAGQVLDLEGKAPFRVRLGAPSAVKINIKGQPFDLSRYPASRPVTLKLPQ